MRNIDEAIKTVDRDMISFTDLKEDLRRAVVIAEQYIDLDGESARQNRIDAINSFMSQLQREADKAIQEIKNYKRKTRN